MQSFDEDIRGRIVALVKAMLEQNAMQGDFASDAKLIDLGLTSMDMVNLMLAVEAEFDFAIPQGEITPENFESVDNLLRMVAEQLQLAAA
jgi:acyl carrier protein